MCGIIGIVSKKSVIKDLKRGLISLMYRGNDSSGVAIIDDGRIVVNKDIGYAENLKIDETLQGTIGIGHTRWATHGKVTKENAHPFTDCSSKLAIVHNGIIENFAELKADLVRNGHVFKSETDSEVIAHLIESVYLYDCRKFDFEQAFIEIVHKLEGSYATVAIHKDYPYIMMARHESPLMIGYTEDSVYIASDIQAFGSNIKNVCGIADNSVDKISLEDIKHQPAGVTYEIGQSDKNDYEHFMLKEIHEQPNTILEALKQDKNQLYQVSMDIMRARNVIWTACGTSRFASLVGRYVINRLVKQMGETVVGSELHYFADSFNNTFLIIATSQSGETADVLTGVKVAKEKGVKIVSIINKPFSSLERMSDVTLFMKCGAEIAVASTKAFTNELILFYLLAFTMANRYEDGLNELKELPDKVRECLKQADKVKKVAEEIKNVRHIYYVGKGINFAVAGECALKLKEVSYIHAESMSAGELKHGTLSLIEKGTPVIGLCPDDYTYQEVISNLHEAKARGALIIGISDKDNEVFDYWFEIPKVKDIYYPLVSVIIGQLLAYYVAVGKGISPDRPRHLAKSVTVR